MTVLVGLIFESVLGIQLELLCPAIPEEGGKGVVAKGDKKCPAQVHIFILVASSLASIRPHVFSWFKEMHMNIAITVHGRQNLFVKSCAFANFRVFNFN